MDEAQARLIIRRYGWTVFIRVKPSGRYLIARKWIDGRLVSCYITAMSRLSRFEADDIKHKLPDVA